ncbi:hypothetical protein [Salmonirosea aquatica]|uniref:DUF4270 family protein n=1 Tax=Salmonirosea aquatica TaxID=2654236 RepID=A0A7C9FYQ4_9BACT|nr:hypothetical protein [Cytophagaceae bacterium SJW1-29]
MKSLKLSAYCLLLLLSASCAKQTVTSFQITSLKALDLEETLTRKDELLMAYTLTSFDASNKAVAVSTGSWGVQEAKTGQEFRENAFQPISIPLPKNGKLVATVVLVEVDDYASAQKTLTEIRRYHDYIKIPAALAELADVALTPLKYLSLALSATGVGFQLADRLDDDDLIGQNNTELTYQQALLSADLKVPLTFKGGHLGSSFHYELNYDLRTQTVRVGRTRKPKS